MAQPIARKGDAHSHGGTITEGSPDIYVNGKPVARKGDHADCPLHGTVTIVDGNESLPINGKAAARVGSRLSCGATITTGSPNIYSNN